MNDTTSDRKEITSAPEEKKISTKGLRRPEKTVRGEDK